MAACCSKRNRSRIELLASITRPTLSGRSVSDEKVMICRGGRLLSRTLNWFCLMFLTNLPCRSVTVKITFTSSDRVRNEGTSLPAAGLPTLEAGLLPVGCWGGAEEAGVWAPAKLPSNARAQNGLKNVARSMNWIALYRIIPATLHYDSSIRRKNAFKSSGRGCRNSSGVLLIGCSNCSAEEWRK